MSNATAASTAEPPVTTPEPSAAEVAHCRQALLARCGPFLHALEGPSGRDKNDTPATLETATQLVTELAKWAVRPFQFPRSLPLTV